MKKVSRLLAYIFMGLTIIIMITFNLIGSKVNSQGILEEPFYLIPLGYTSFILGIIFFMISLIKKKN